MAAEEAIALAFDARLGDPDRKVVYRLSPSGELGLEESRSLCLPLNRLLRVIIVLLELRDVNLCDLVRRVLHHNLDLLDAENVVLQVLQILLLLILVLLDDMQ